MTKTLPLYPSYLRRQATALIDDLQEHAPERLDLLRRDPVTALQQWPDLTVEWEQRARRSGCSVAGWYERETATVHLVRGGSPERRNFTACHELGHHLQRHHLGVAGELATYHASDPDRILEDRICDTFASRVLIPDTAMPELGRLGPTAADFIAVHENTGASRAACAVRIADELDVEGWVIVANTEGEVLFAAAAHHEFRLARGTQQLDSSLITKAGSHGPQQGLESVTFPRGTVGPQYNTDARETDGYVFAVMTVGAAPWAPGPVLDRDRWARAPEFECESASCGATFTRFTRRCTKCEQPLCPECSRCPCSTTASRRICEVCSMVRAEVEMPDGSDTCIYCL